MLPDYHVLPKWVDNLHTSGAAANSYTVPAGVSKISISGDVNLWIQTNGGTAAIPSGNVSTGIGSLFVSVNYPRFFSVTVGDVISIFTTAAGNVSIEGWA